MKAVKTYLKELVGNTPASPHGEVEAGLGFVCKSGTHRSVAMARMVLECLIKDGFQVSGPRHLSKGTWVARNRCSDCHMCDLNNRNKPFFFDLVHAEWKRL